jgi:hypothetical protein
VKRAVLDLSFSEAKILLEALALRERQLDEICRTSDDEDVVADAGNDLIEVRLFQKSAREALVKIFGRAVLNTQSDPL